MARTDTHTDRADRQSEKERKRTKASSSRDGARSLQRRLERGSLLLNKILPRLMEKDISNGCYPMPDDGSR